MAKYKKVILVNLRTVSINCCNYIIIRVHIVYVLRDFGLTFCLVRINIDELLDNLCVHVCSKFIGRLLHVNVHCRHVTFIQGRNHESWGDSLMASAEREPIMGVWGLCLQWGPVAKPLVGGQGTSPPWSWQVFSKWDIFCNEICSSFANLIKC